MGIRITTDKKGVKVWRSDKYDKPRYAIQVGKKEGDTWVNKYQRVRFKDSPDIPNGTVVHITDGFEALDTWVKDGVEHTEIIIIAMDYTYDGMKTRPVPTFINMSDLPDTFSAAQDEIPF